MAIRNSEQRQVSIPPAPPLPSPAEQLRTRFCNTVFKTGPLFLSSKGIGWTSWKKRWFILTRTSLVFFRSDPSAVPQKGSEVNLTLGGIDLNNSGSVVVKADKKLLTVIFPDGRDGRTFTLKAETLEDLQEWKTALESALAQAPNHPMGQNVDRPPVKISVIGRPILLALEDVDGSPSFLEKALQFIEEHGVKVEGILRQAADVDDVERRVREYEQGKNEFSFEEDAHVIADCVKYVIRELPSSPVPASCCKALLQACRTERSIRVNAMRTAICETFPEPNRRLLQRILMMMKKVATHKAENRMSCPAVAACMAPLLLRPLLAGECEIENDFDLGGDGSVQLLQAAAAANHAQAIVITLLDEYDKIFGEGSVLLEPYTDSEESGSESEEATDDESYEDENDHGSQGSDSETEGDPENSSSVTCSERGDSGNKSPYDNKESAGSISGSDSSEVDDNNKTETNLSSSSLQTPPLQPVVQRSEDKPTQNSNNSVVRVNDSPVAPRETTPQTSSISKPVGHGIPACIQISTTLNVPEHILRKRRTWGRTAGRKNLSLESIDYGEEDEVEVQRLEFTKYELKNRITEEVKENAVLQTNLEIRKKDLHQRRLTLEIEVAQLKKQLQKERDLRVALEAGLHMSHGTLPNLDTVDEKTKADLEEIAVAEAEVVSLTQKLGELGMHFNRQRELHHGSTSKSGNLPQKIQGHQTRLMDKQKENEVNSPSYFEKSRNKDSHLDSTEIEYESKVQSASVSNKHLPRIQKTDSLSSSKYSSIEASVDTSTPKSAVSKRSSSRRSSTKVEGSVSTNAALTKLTTRLNFLKERRNQIAHDLQNVDIRGSPRVVQSPIKGREQYLNKDRSQGSEAKSTQNLERVREIDSYNLIQNQDRSVGKEGQPSQNPDKLRKVESQSLGYPDRSKRSEVHDFHSLERGKSENHKSLNIDKGRVVEGGQPFMPSRTSTR